MADDRAAVALADAALKVADLALTRHRNERFLLRLPRRASYQASRGAWEAVNETNRLLGYALRSYENRLKKITRSGGGPA